MKSKLAVLHVAAAFAALGAPTVSNVAIVQDSDTKRVTVTYDLDEAAIVTAEFFADGERPETPPTLAGDVNRFVQAGAARTIVWQPSIDWPLRSAASVTAKVSAWTKAVPPDYMVVKLFDDGAEINRWYYASTNDIPGGISNRIYKSDYLVMRRIPAKGIKSRLGNDSTRTIKGNEWQTYLVSFTNDYYMAIYEFTEAQHAAVGGSRYAGPYFTNESYAAEQPYLPVTGVFWKNDIRGGVGVTDAPAAASVMGKLRARTGIATFDLPTDAQWEYACRAKTATTLNDGTDTDWNGAGAENMKRVAWCSLNSEGRPHEVGLKKPNAWGLYDMLGNAAEWTRDRQHTHEDTEDVVDPVWTDTSQFYRRGGSYENDGVYVNSGSRGHTHGGWGGDKNKWTGFRPMCLISE